MAGKLSRIAQHGCCLLAVGFWLPVAASALGDEGLRVSPAAKVIENPFTASARRVPAAGSQPQGATGSSPQRVAGGDLSAREDAALTDKPPVTRTTPSASPRMYQNPFVTPPTASLEIMPIGPGPISRWRPPILQPRTMASDNAVSGDPCTTASLPTQVADGLQTVSLVQPRGSTSAGGQETRAQEQETSAQQADRAGMPANPFSSTGTEVDMSFAATAEHGVLVPESLVQPPWLLPDDGAEPLGASNPLVGPTPEDPFEASQPRATGGLSASAWDIRADKSPPATRCGELPVPPAVRPASLESAFDVNVTPADVETSSPPQPQDWLARAQLAARTADAPAELSALIVLCQRGIASDVPPRERQALRQLAAWALNRRGELVAGTRTGGSAGRPESALDDFQAAIDLDPQCWLALHNRAVSYAQQQRTSEALQDFNRVIALNPGLAVAYRNRGELLGSLDRHEEAIRDYTQAISQLPDDAELYLMRGHAWHRLGHYDRALDDLDRSIALAPDQPDAYTHRGNVHAEQGEFREATADFRHSLTLDPNCADAYRSLAWLLATCPDPHVRNTQQAVEAAQRAAELAPTRDCHVLDALAAAYASAGRFDKAIQYQQQALAASPKDFTSSLRERLELYQQRQPYRNAPASAVQQAAYEGSAQPPAGRRTR
jgi:tetratricopeptide (TPR) repeat protein